MRSKRAGVRPPLFYGWYVVGAAFALVFSGFGCTYAFGAFFLPLASSFEATRAEVSAVFSYAVAVIFISGALSGQLADRFGPRPVVLLGVIAMIAGLLGAAGATSLARVSVNFMLGLGIGVGFVYVPAIGAVQRWFDRRRGLASGIALTGIGLGTLVMPLLVASLLTTMNWRGVMVVLAVVVAACCIPALFFLERDPAARGLAPDGDGTHQAVAYTAPTETLWALVRSRPFRQLYVAQLVISCAIMVPFVHIVPYAIDLSIAPKQAAGLVSLIGLGSMLGRMTMGGVADRFGRKPTQVVLFVALGASYLAWFAAESYPSLILFALGYGIFYGGFIALMPALIADYFSGPRLSSVIGLQYTSAAFGSLIGPVAAGTIYDRTGAYGLALLVAAVLCVLSATLLAATTPP